MPEYNDIPFNSTNILTDMQRADDAANNKRTQIDNNYKKVLLNIFRYQYALNNAKAGADDNAALTLSFMIKLNQQLIEYLRYLQKSQHSNHTQYHLELSEELVNTLSLDIHKAIETMHEIMEKNNDKIYEQRHDYRKRGLEFFILNLVLTGIFVMPLIFLANSPGLLLGLLPIYFMMMIPLSSAISVCFSRLAENLTQYNQSFRHHHHWKNRLEGEHTLKLENKTNPSNRKTTGIFTRYFSVIRYCLSDNRDTALKITEKKSSLINKFWGDEPNTTLMNEVKTHFDKPETEARAITRMRTI